MRAVERHASAMSMERHTGGEPLEQQRLVLFAVATAACTVGWHFGSGSRVWDVAALAAILFGVWHGAYDAVLAERVLPRWWGAAWRPAFYVAYLLLAGAVLLLWLALPVVALALFLLYSALHFGTEAEHGRSAGVLLGGLALGFVPIAAACYWWAPEVQEVFAAMLRGNMQAAGDLASGAGALLLPAVLGALAGAGRDPWRFLSRAALLGVELLLFRFCPPVLAFAVFFCLWHTPEHLLETSRGLSGTFSPHRMASNLRRGLAPWLLSVAAVAVAAWLGRHTAVVYSSVLFIALSALTVPHMALAMMLETQGSVAQSRRVPRGRGWAHG